MGVVYPEPSKEAVNLRKNLVPDCFSKFKDFSKTVFSSGSIDEKTKHLIAIAVAHVTKCPYCIKSHTRMAKNLGASDQEIMEAIWVAVEMSAGASYAHSIIALQEIVDERKK